MADDQPKVPYSEGDKEGFEELMFQLRRRIQSAEDVQCEFMEGIKHVTVNGVEILQPNGTATITIRLNGGAQETTE